VKLNIRVMMLKIQLRLHRNELHFNIKKQYIEKFFLNCNAIDFHAFTVLLIK